MFPKSHSLYVSHTILLMLPRTPWHESYRGHSCMGSYHPTAGTSPPLEILPETTMRNKPFQTPELTLLLISLSSFKNSPRQHSSSGISESSRKKAGAHWIPSMLTHHAQENHLTVTLLHSFPALIEASPNLKKKNMVSLILFYSFVFLVPLFLVPYPKNNCL